MLITCNVYVSSCSRKTPVVVPYELAETLGYAFGIAYRELFSILPRNSCSISIKVLVRHKRWTNCDTQQLCITICPFKYIDFLWSWTLTLYSFRKELNSFWGLWRLQLSIMTHFAESYGVSWKLRKALESSSHIPQLSFTYRISWKIWVDLQETAVPVNFGSYMKWKWLRISWSHVCISGSAVWN